MQKSLLVTIIVTGIVNAALAQNQPTPPPPLPARGQIPVPMPHPPLPPPMPRPVGVLPTALGIRAPELNLPGPDGKKLKLSEINKGRYVLLDFWSSWCLPCRAANPKVVKLYEAYSKKKFRNAPKGFTIVSYSFDLDKAQWIDAIKKDGLAWPYHFTDFKGWQSPVCKQYGVDHIPQAFLLGPDGKIIMRYGNVENVEADLEKYVLPERVQGK